MPVTTEIPKTQVAPLAGQSFAIRALATRSLASQFWFILWLLTLAFALITPIYLTKALKKTERVVILDQAGTFHISPLLNFEDSNELHTSQAMLATLSLYQRNPDGFDLPEQLQRMFARVPYEQAVKEWEQDAPEFRVKQIRQKVEISELNILETQARMVIVEVKGQLFRSYLFQGKPFSELPLNLNLTLTLVRNPDLGNNNRFPLVVAAYDSYIDKSIGVVGKK